MGKAKVKVKAREGKSGTKIAETKIAVSQTEQPQQKRRLFQTRAEMNIHIRSGQRPSEFRYRRTR
jgi:hypothetical protein